MPDQPEEGQVDNTLTEGDSTGPVETSNDNATPEVPDWNNILEVVPESLHSLVRPEIEKYAESQTSQYKELETKYEPWNDVLQHDIENVQRALNFASHLDQHPVEAYNHIKTWLVEQGMLEEDAPGTAPAQEAEPVSSEDEIDFDDPALKKFADSLNTDIASLKDVVQGLAQRDEEARRAQQEQQQQTALDDFLGGLEKKHQFFDKDYVVSQMARGVSGDQAAKAYEARVIEAAKKLNEPSEEAPKVIGGGGSLPTNQVSPGQLSGKDREALVVQLLQKEANGGS
jgi:hypothetical protein